MMLRTKGFTLIEMLIAVLMIAILFTMVFASIDSATDSRQATKDAAKELVNLQRAFIWLGKDIGQLNNREARDAYGTLQPALTNNSGQSDRVLEFSRDGWPILAIKTEGAQERADIVRIAYELHPNEKASSKSTKGDVYDLYRLYWVYADRASEEPKRKRRIATGITSFKTKFMNEQKNWEDSWPPLSQQQGGLPRAVAVEIELQGWGKLRRIFRVVAGHGV